MTSLDFSPLFRTTVGFDRLMSSLDRAMQVEDGAGHSPPYNIERTGEDAYRVTLAVAGFSESDLEIEVREGELIVAGQVKEDGKRDYVHRGIAPGRFRRSFRLAEHVKAVDARLENGLLSVDLVREVPEALKPRRIPIASAAKGPAAIAA